MNSHRYHLSQSQHHTRPERQPSSSLTTNSNLHATQCIKVERDEACDEQTAVLSMVVHIYHGDALISTFYLSSGYSEILAVHTRTFAVSGSPLISDPSTCNEPTWVRPYQ